VSDGFTVLFLEKVTMPLPTKVHALYDFQGQPGTSELSIKVGEILTVTNISVGEGWWEGTNEKGEVGLFPAAYVETYEVAEPNEPNDWEEEWDDDWESQSNAPTNELNPSSFPTSTVLDNQDVPGDNSVSTTIQRKAFNRHSSFFKSGGESYIFGASKVIPESEKVRIIETENGIMWEPLTDNYICSVASPKKETKLKGFKSFIAYQLTPSFNNIQVSRRYKHFDWLHARLELKYSLIPIPPLPDKQISGRYEEQFIEHRKNQLQAFVDCVCRHPVLSRSPVWQHFITCTDEKMWKTGKRRAEKDELVGAMYFYAIETPERPINQFTLDQELLSCAKFVHNMDGAVKNLMETAIDQTKKHQGHYKREFQKIGHAFYALGQAMGTESTKSGGHENLTDGIKMIGDAYNHIARMFEEQPKLDWEPLGDMLYVYKGILTSMPDILNFHKEFITNKKDCEKLAFEQKITHAQLEKTTKRTDSVSYILLAEINQFYNERAEEVSKSLKNYLTQQITFYQKVVAELQNALSAFDA